LAKKGRKASRKAKSATEWTFLEKALAVICVVLVVVAAYAFTVREEIVEVGSIETYEGTVDLRAGDPNASEFSFTRQLKVDYRVKLSYRTLDGEPGDRPEVHFKVWNQSLGRTLFHETTVPTYDRDYIVDPADAGTYDFQWWVEGDSGSVRVDIEALIQPTEKLFEKRQ
jgi:hypothetical protein